MIPAYSTPDSDNLLSAPTAAHWDRLAVPRRAALILSGRLSKPCATITPHTTRFRSRSRTRLRETPVRRFPPDHGLFAFGAPAVLADHTEVADDAVAGDQVGDGVASKG